MLTTTVLNDLLPLQIPNNYIKKDRKLITIPNRNNIKIEPEDDDIVKIDDLNLAYQENVPLRKLKMSKHCIRS